jgi:oxygen-independent coproporphyrinogen-3 oxidase
MQASAEKSQRKISSASDEQTFVNKCVDILEGKVNISKLWHEGFKRDPLKYYFVITYPPVTLASPLKEEKLFKNISYKNKKIGLYFHIPFCSRKCTFCPYVSNYPNEIDKYLAFLEKEVLLFKKYRNADFSQVSTVYIGGGSPSILNINQITKLLRIIHDNFKISAKAEFSIELHPELINKDYKSFLQVLKEYNVNRISVAAQTFEDQFLRSTNRGHNSEETIKLFNEVKKNDFSCVGIDLLYGLPDQTIESWIRDLNLVFKLNPDIIATYCLEVRDWTNIYNLYKEEKERFPDEYLSSLFYVMGSEIAERKGFNQNPPMYYSKSNNSFEYATDILGMPMASYVIGFGVSAYSWINGYQYFNVHNFNNYYEKLDNNSLPIWKGSKLSHEDLMAREAMLNIRLKTKIDILNFESIFHKSIFDIYGDTINKLIQVGLLKYEGNKLLLTYSGFMFADEICTFLVPESTRKKLYGLKGKYDRFYRL